MRKRYLESPILQDLRSKMVFVAGPRQTGKTTLAQQIATQYSQSLYLSWDQSKDRRKLIQANWPAESALLIFDELHKYKKWKRWIKGEFDKHRNLHHFLVTGSARMDVYRRGGDSLQGRYHHYRLHPFTLNELENRQPLIQPFQELSFSSGGPASAIKEDLSNLLRFSGFPEPCLALDERTHRRWQKERMDRFFREDVRDLDVVRNLSGIQLLADLLPERCGSLLSLNALREDLDVSHKAVVHWLNVLEQLYFCFRVRPYNVRKIRSLKKQPKLYLWDHTLLQDIGTRYENLIALHLLKTCHYLEDHDGYKTGLHVLRDADQKEVDFLVCENGKPWLAVEVKASDRNLSTDLCYFKEKLQIPYCYQVVFEEDIDVMKNGIRIMSAAKFLTGLL